MLITYVELRSTLDKILTNARVIEKYRVPPAVATPAIAPATFAPKHPI